MKKASKGTIEHQALFSTAIFMAATLWLLGNSGLAAEIKPIKIIDESGNPIQSFQCMVQWKEFDENNKATGSITWKDVESENGFINIDIENIKVSSKEKTTSEPRANGMSMLLMAEGYAPECVQYRFEDIPDKIILEKAMTVYLERKKETVSGHPIVVPTSHISELFYQREFPLKVKQVNSDKWECKLKKGQSYVVGWKTGKGGWFSKEIVGYCSEPFTVEKDGQTANFEPGMPITFEYDLSNAPKFLNIHKYPVHIWLYKTVPGLGDDKFWFSQKASVETKKAKIVKISGLAAGTYYLDAYNSPGNSSMPQLSDRREITLAPEAYRIEPVYPVLDTAVEPGDVTIEGTVLDADKKPISSETVSLWLQQFDENKRLKPVPDTFYKPAQTEEAGKFEFKGVMPGQDVMLNLTNRPTEGIFLARNSLKENAKIEVSFVVGQKKELISVGKPFAFPTVRLENNEKKSLNEFKGKIVIIDLWASWCSPCLRSMPELSELAKQIQSEDIQFITLSIDSDQQSWKNRLAENNWPFLLHTWFDDTVNNHKLRHNGGIPFCIIVDKEGIVRVAGNGVDIKSELEKLRESSAL
ncbi:MAG: TlpA family protein disulfide reductase [Planctomycetota bacterium]